MMTKDEFRQAFREASIEQVEADITAYNEKYGNNAHTFSKDFEESMDRYFSTGKPKYRGFRNTQKRRRLRIMVSVIAALIALAATACAVPQIRESVAGFFVRVFENHTEYTNPSATKTRIEEKYGLDPIPDGFSTVKIESSDTDLITTYSDNENNIFLLYQSAGSSIQSEIDNQHGSFKEYSIGEKTVRVYYSEKSAQASWIENGYYFSITYSAHIELSVFEEIIGSVLPIED